LEACYAAGDDCYVADGWGVAGKLDKLAAATRRSRSFLAAEAIPEYVELNAWQIEEIQKGLMEAERGELLRRRRCSG
jgi:predicted transcriptional regulator